MTDERGPAYFDRWFTDIANSPERQALFTRVLGVPAEVGPSNVVPVDGLQEIATALRIPREGLLVDLACGRGGPGMWLARQAGVELVGVDFSPEAIVQATERRALFGLEATATFAVGTLEDTGLTAGMADAVVCVDGIQFASDGVAAATEILRILRPGGCVVLTSWEAKDRNDEGVGERLRRVDLARWLSEGGFVEVVVAERTSWHETGRELWRQALELDPGDDPALQSTYAEAERSLQTFDQLRRVLATATAPSRSPSRDSGHL